MVYDVDGNLTGSWTAKKSDSATGIATDGTDVWVADSGDDAVHRYSGAASHVSGNQFPTSSFDLVAGSPGGITTDGNTLWVVDYSTDHVYRYTTAGVMQGSWPLHSANTDPRGLTIDPTGASTSVWVLDSDRGAVYEYDRDTGEYRGIFYLDTAAGNSSPSGIADPPPSTAGAAMPQPQSYRSGDEPVGNGALFTREELMVPAVLPQRHLEPRLRTLSAIRVIIPLVVANLQATMTGYVTRGWSNCPPRTHCGGPKRLVMLTTSADSTISPMRRRICCTRTY